MSELHRFLFEGIAVRGAIVRITSGWQELLRRRTGTASGPDGGAAYPPPVQTLLGEMSAAALLMQSGIKFNGSLILQIQGDGPVKLAVAEAQPDLAFRSTAQVRGDVPPDATWHTLVNRHGEGRCAITLDPRDRQPGQQPYQGVVPLGRLGGADAQGWTLADSLAQYMAQSEQLQTRFVLAANEHAACGLMVQRMPTQGAQNRVRSDAQSERDAAEQADEDYHRIATLALSLQPDELLQLPSLEVLHRLFWDEKLLRHEPQDGSGDRPAPRFACTCSRERVARMIETLGRAEADEIVRDKGAIDVGCDFCGQHHTFDAVDVGRLFTAAHQQMPGSGLSH